MGSVLQAELASEIAQWQYLVALYRLSKEAHSPSSKRPHQQTHKSFIFIKKESSNNSLLIILMILMMMITSRARGSRQTISGRMMEARRKRIALQLHSQIYIYCHHHYILLTENCLYPRYGHCTNCQY